MNCIQVTVRKATCSDAEVMMQIQHTCMDKVYRAPTLLQHSVSGKISWTLTTSLHKLRLLDGVLWLSSMERKRMSTLLDSATSIPTLNLKSLLGYLYITSVTFK